MFETLSRAVAGRAGIIAEVTLSYIAFETWSGKPEPGTRLAGSPKCEPIEYLRLLSPDAL
jgi:hypothetical protein